MADLILSLDDLTLAEIESIEDRAGAPLNVIQERSIAKLAHGLAFVAKTRSDPGLDLDEAWSDAGSLKMVDVANMFGGDDDVDPTEEGD